MTDLNKKNKFLIWAPSKAPNMMSDAAYAEALKEGNRFFNGVTRGLAESKQINKSLRQSTVLTTALIEHLFEIFPNYKNDITDAIDPKQLGSLLFAALRYAANDKRTLKEAEIHYTEKGYEKGYITYADNQLLVSIAEGNFDKPSIASKKWLPLDDGYIKSIAKDKKHHIIYEMAMKDDPLGPLADAIIHSGGKEEHIFLPSDRWVDKTLKDYVKSARTEQHLQKVFDLAIKTDKEGQFGDALIHDGKGAKTSVLLAGVNWVKKRLLDYIESENVGKINHKIYKFTIRDEKDGQVGDAIIHNSKGAEESVTLAGTKWIDKNLKDYIKSIPAKKDQHKILDLTIQDDPLGPIADASIHAPAEDGKSVTLAGTKWVDSNLTHYIKSDKVGANHHKVNRVTIRTDKDGDVGEFYIPKNEKAEQLVELVSMAWVKKFLDLYIESPVSAGHLQKIFQFSIKEDKNGILGEAKLKKGVVDLTSTEWVKKSLEEYIESPAGAGHLHKILQLSIKEDKNGTLGEAKLKKGVVDLTSTEWVKKALESYIETHADSTTPKEHIHRILQFYIKEDKDGIVGEAKIKDKAKDKVIDLVTSDWVNKTLAGYVFSPKDAPGVHRISEFFVKEEKGVEFGRAKLKKGVIDFVTTDWADKTLKEYIVSPPDSSGPKGHFHKILQFSIKEEKNRILGEAKTKTKTYDFVTSEWVDKALERYIDSAPDSTTPKGAVHKVLQFNVKEEKGAKFGVAKLKKGEVDLVTTDWVDKSLENYISSPKDAGHLHKISEMSVKEEKGFSFVQAKVKQKFFLFAGVDWVKSLIKEFIVSEKDGPGIHRILQFFIKDEKDGPVGRAKIKTGNVDLASTKWVEKKISTEVVDVQNSVLYDRDPAHRKINAFQQTTGFGGWLRFPKPFHGDAWIEVTITPMTYDDKGLMANIRNGSITAMGCTPLIFHVRKGETLRYGSNLAMNVLAVGLDQK